MSRLEAMFRATEELNRRTILDMITPQPGSSLLDVGCGDGSFTVRVAERLGAADVHGVELIDHIAAEARGRGVQVEEATLAAPLPYAAETFDVVQTNQVIEHLDNTDIFLTEIRRVLKPSGYLVISTNNLASWHNIGSLVMGWQPMASHVSDHIIVGNPLNFVDGRPGYLGQMHRRIFTNKALRDLAAHHGLVLQADRTAGFYPFGPRLAERLTRLDRRHGAFLVQRFGVDPAIPAAL